MGKSRALFIVASLLIIGASIWTYAHQNNNRGANKGPDSLIKARLIGFELYRYQNDELKARTSGKSATLKDHGKLVCEDKIRSVRIRNGVREELEANTANIQFVNDAVLTQKNNTVDTIELSGNVEFSKGPSKFQTEWILYTEKTGDAFTDKPVRADSEGQFVAAEGGMTYNVRSESIRMRGGVFGSVRTDAVETGLGGQKKKHD